MSVEGRVERIKTEQVRATEQWKQLKEEKEKEFTAHARFINSRLEQLKALQVIGMIEEFTKSKLTPIFIREDYVPELEYALPGPLKGPSAEDKKVAFARPDPKEWWSAQVLNPLLDQETLEWDTNLKMKISHHQTSRDRLMRSQFDSSPVAWVDLTWFTRADKLSVEGKELTYSQIVAPYELPNLDQLEEGLAQAIVNPKRPTPRIRHFDMHTPIGAEV